MIEWMYEQIHFRGDIDMSNYQNGTNSVDSSVNQDELVNEDELVANYGLTEEEIAESDNPGISSLQSACQYVGVSWDD